MNYYVHILNICKQIPCIKYAWHNMKEKITFPKNAFNGYFNIQYYKVATKFKCFIVFSSIKLYKVLSKLLLLKLFYA